MNTPNLFGQNEPPKTKTRSRAKAKQPQAEPERKTGTAVAVHQPRPPAQAKPTKITNAATMLNFIGQASMNPRVKPEKMQALLDIRKQLKQEEAREAFDAAFFKLQKDIATIRITKRGLIKIFAKNDPEHQRAPIQSTPYAKYDDLSKIIRPMLHANGFVLKHSNGSGPDGKPKLITRLVHKGGAFDESEFIGEIDASGSKNNVQGRGSTLAYGKRYNTVSLLDIITEEDDDARLGKDDPITEFQYNELLNLCDDHNVDKRLFCQHFGVESLRDVPKSRFDAAKAEIQRKPKAAK